VLCNGGPEPFDPDVIDEICEVTLHNGGDVVEMSLSRMPAEGSVAAVLRY